MTNLTKSQVKTLQILEASAGWMTNNEITALGGNSSSVCNLMTRGMVIETEFNGMRFWSSINQKEQAIAFEYAKINPHHKYIESLSGEACRYITGVQVLVSQATAMGDGNGYTAMEILMETINYVVKQETCGQPLDAAQATIQLEALHEMLREGVLDNPTKTH